MVDQIHQNIAPVQTIPQIPPSVPPSTNWLKIILPVVFGLIITISSVFIGIKIGKKQNTTQTPQTEIPTIYPTQAVASPTTLILELQDQTTWKTHDFGGYTKEYTFKYPNYSDWQDSGPSMFKDGAHCDKCSEFDNINSFLIASYYDTLQEAQKYWEENNIRYEKINFKGLDAWKIVEPSKDPKAPSTLGICILYNNKTYIIYLTYPNLFGITDPTKFPEPIPNIPATVEFKVG